MVLSKQKYRMVMTATFTRLLLMRMVASRRSLSRSRAATFLSERCLPSSIVLLSAGVRLKKAISLAETNPEQKSRNRTMAKAIHTSGVGDCVLTV